MTDNLGTLLRDAGDLLDEWADEHVVSAVSPGPVATDGDAPLYVASIEGVAGPATGPAGGERGHTGRFRLFATAAVLLAVALVAAALVGLPGGSEDGAPPVASSGGQVVALAPGRAWLGGATHISGASGLSEIDVVQTDPAPDHVVVSPAGVDVDPRLAVSIYRAGEIQVPRGSTIVRDGVTAVVIDSYGDDEVLLYVRHDGAQDWFGLRAGPDSTVDVLLRLAATVDPTTPLADQEFAGAWRVVADRAGPWHDYTTVMWTLSLDDHAVQGMTFTAPTDDMAWFLGNPFASVDHPVRGTTARITVTEFTSDLVWVEEPGVVHYLVVANPGTLTVDERRELLLDLAEDLVPVDRVGWAEFLDRHAVEAEEPRGDVDTTTTEVSAPVVDDAALAEYEDQLAQAYTSGRPVQEFFLLDLRRHLFVTDTGDGQLCLMITGLDVECNETHVAGDPSPRALIGRDGDGQPVLIYGSLPPGATTVEFGHDDNVPPDSSTVISGHNEMWMFDLTVMDPPRTLTYRNSDGQVIGRQGIEVDLG